MVSIWRSAIRRRWALDSGPAVGQRARFRDDGQQLLRQQARKDLDSISVGNLPAGKQQRFLTPSPEWRAFKNFSYGVISKTTPAEFAPPCDVVP
jgi:hypothetical protein